MERKVNISTNDYGLDVLAKFNSFREENKYCDFIIRTEGKSMPVHRCVIAASSEYFDGMLSHDTKERRGGIVEIQDADSRSIRKCVEFMYTGKASVCDENRVDLMHVSHMLRLHRLYNGIATLLESELDCETFFATRAIANRYDCSKLVEVCDNFALENFRAIVKMDDFKKIEAKYLSFLLSAKGLNERDRGKCKALMAWVNYDSTRAASLFSMMKHIEFVNVPLSYRRFLMDHEATISESNECLKLVMKSIFDTEKIKASDTLLDSSIIVLDHKSRKIKCLDVEDGIWSEFRDIHWHMRSKISSVVILDGYLYALVDGGSNYRIKYEECNARWEAVAQRSGRWGLAVVLNGCIYVTEHNQYSNRIERYCPWENRWSFIPNRKRTIAYTAVAAAGGCLFEFGGICTNDFDNEYNYATMAVQKFNPKSLTWSKPGNLKQHRYQASAVTLDNVIYVLGGLISANAYAKNLEIFRPYSNTTELVILPDLSRAEFMSHALNGMIYLVAGDSAQPPTVSAYNPKTKALTKVVTMDGISMRTCESVLAFND